jgi:hypothetical protein
VTRAEGLPPEDGADRSREAVRREAVLALVRSIRAERLPRNRHFDVHQSVEGHAARRLHRFLRGVERDLMRAHGVGVSAAGDQLHITLEFPEVRSRRVVALTPEEFALIVEDAALRERLAAAGRNP